jgi:NAD(P) transhydrogenase subunit alpha
MTIGVLKEPQPESRVSLLPEHIVALKKQGVNVLTEAGAGKKHLRRMKNMQKREHRSPPEMMYCKKLISYFLYSHYLKAILHMCKAKVLFGFYQPLYNYEYIHESK